MKSGVLQERLSNERRVVEKLEVDAGMLASTKVSPYGPF